MGVHARQTKTGINIATSGSWGTGAATATAVGAGDGLYVRDDLKVQLKARHHTEEVSAQSFIGAVQVGRTEAIEATIPCFLHYMDAFQNVLWALTMGTGGTAPTQLGGSTAYTNTFEPGTNKIGLYATLVRDKVQIVSEVPGCKFTGFELRVADNGVMEIDWMFTGDTEKSDSTINTATQVSALTFPTQGMRAFFDDLVFRINAQAGGALGASDAIKITNIKVSMKQPMDVKHVGGQLTIIECRENGFPEFMIDITFARFDSVSDDYFAAHRDGTRYKADMTLTGPVITGSTFYALLMQFPNVDVDSFVAAVPGAANQVAPTMRLRALSTTAAPTGMTGVTVPLRVTTTGTSLTNPFT